MRPAIKTLSWSSPFSQVSVSTQTSPSFLTTNSLNRVVLLQNVFCGDKRMWFLDWSSLSCWTESKSIHYPCVKSMTVADSSQSPISISHLFHISGISKYCHHPSRWSNRSFTLLLHWNYTLMVSQAKLPVSNVILMRSSLRDFNYFASCSFAGIWHTAPSRRQGISWSTVIVWPHGWFTGTQVQSWNINKMGQLVKWSILPLD